MNKTITMNLSGIIFHVEEDAYDMLNNYLKAIRSYFNQSDSRDEIMSDIESRIAEMLQERVSKNKQAVLIADVNFVIEVMGKPEEFGYEGDTREKSSATNESNSSKENRKRIFRDPDDKIFGGVCSGIANYFDFDPLWLRAAFAISFFVFGSGFLLYIILLIIIPKAKTTAEKLEMRGERVDINNIGKVVNEEFDEFKKRVKEFEKEFNTKENKRKVKTAGQKFTFFISNLISNTLRVLGKFFATAIIVLGVTLLIVFIVGLFGRGSISLFASNTTTLHISLIEFLKIILPKSISSQLVIIGLILFIAIPLLSLIISGLKYLLGIKQKNKVVKYTANIFWLIGLTILVYVGIEIGMDFSEEAAFKQKIELIQPTGKTLSLDVASIQNGDDDFSHFLKHKNIHFGDWEIISQNDSAFFFGYPTLNIVKSDTDTFELYALKSANGFDKKEANYRAKRIEYSVKSSDSSLVFDNFFEINKIEKLRAQDVQLILKVPINKSVFISKNMEQIIFDIENIQNAYDSDMVNRKWTMTENGLSCIDCNDLIKRK